MRTADKTNAMLSRRTLLAGAGLAAAAAAAVPAETRAAPRPSWDQMADIVCVGSGAAACSAAVTAAAAGAEVIVVEKMPFLGGTTGKSGGVVWICNHFGLRAQGIRDEKADAMAYMCRFSFPQIYDPTSPTLGLTEADYRLIEAFYDHGYKAIDHLQAVEAVRFKQFRLWAIDEPAPDYADHLPENKVPTGRALEPATGSGGQGGGSLAMQLTDWLERHQVPILTETRVTRIVIHGGRAVGVEAESNGKTIRIGARKAVIFGTGGYAHNLDLVGLHQTALYGSCAMPGSTGDFIPIAGAAGAAMGTLDGAWRTQVLLEEALENRELGVCAFFLPGDSMVLLNKYGRRVVNEKRCYNDRTRVHFVYDPVRDEYPNQLLFMLFDQRSLDRFGGAYPMPAAGTESPYLVKGDSWDALFARLDAKLSSLGARSGGVRLAPGFAAAAVESIGRYDGYARTGRDADFDRGAQLYDVQWHKLFSAAREGSTHGANPYPNITMHPFSGEGPYYAFILAAGALDTNGGPRINHHAQLLSTSGQPIPGLYGAGNCIAAPTRNAYYGAGGTIGPALTFGYIAANHALGRST